ncbi:hypothetical protein [Xanthomonas campestris]|uniref:hypothetical protein n=1 Tax=Xanthomonas campestris TaxID=339 RepID=UPI003CEF5BD5
MEIGDWGLAAGGWRLAAGGWRLAAGGWRLAAGDQNLACIPTQIARWGARHAVSANGDFGMSV